MCVARTALRSLSLSYITLENATGPPALRSLKLPLLSHLVLRHTQLGLTAPLLLRPSTLPRLQSLTLRHTQLSTTRLVAAFISLAPQLLSLSLDLSRDDPINHHLSHCTALTLLEYFPTTSTANLLELHDRPLAFLQLNAKTGANASAVRKARDQIELALDKCLVSVSELQALYLPDTWMFFPEEKEELRILCQERGIRMRECDEDSISIPMRHERDWQ